MKIKRVAAREIYNSQGWPTVQCEIFLDNGMSVHASVPSGTSIGIHEAVEFRDGGTRLGGKGVLKAVEIIEQKIAPLLLDQSPKALEMDLRMIELDGTADKSRLGANSLLAVSMALY
ncbi:phosphopyruvate hydratase, partial [Candidatus Dependentiae bacterium]|nr:phosphopyruvate hydratase [Candidatus Dependentiae bacterium]